MSSHNDIYNKYFFDRATEMEIPSADAVVDILIGHFNPVSVIDIGCGPGLYLKKFAERGIDISGYDASAHAIKESLVGDKIKFHDLRFPVISYRRFGLCLCIEVGEHLPLSSSEILVRSLTNLSDTIAFSAATPGQGSLGIGHINEQPHEFWIDKFNTFDFVLDWDATEKIRKEMKERDVIWWVVKNIMIFKKQEKQL